MARTMARSGTRYARSGGSPVSTVPFTLQGWVRATVAEGGTNAYICLWDGTGSVCVLAFSPNSGMALWALRQPSANFVQTSNTLSLNVWYPIGVRATSATDFALWFNGASIGTSSTSSNPTGLNEVVLGLFGATEQPTADMAEVALWNVALTDNEMVAYARGVKPSKIRPLNLHGYWPLYGNDSPEPDLHARSNSSANNMTLTNSPAKANHAPIAL